MEENVVYIKAPMSVSVSEKKLFLKDVLEITGVDKKLVQRIENQLLYSFSGKQREKEVFSIMKIIRMIHETCPEVQVVSVGEPDFVVEYKMEEAPEKWQELLKLSLLCVIVFIGSAFTIMTFNTDVSVEDVFDHFYQMVAGGREGMGSLLEASYCVGIFIGIMAFYNHFSKKKLKEDPTPIHVEMRNYEEEMNKAIMEDAAREDSVVK
ncbi:MAG: stage V sporulation protein AA [Lachnospiraceae bacterium]|nr:stage V sporulation protein AA [Lachnospiraceae bacterium]